MLTVLLFRFPESDYVQAMLFSLLSFLSFYLGSLIVALVHYVRWVEQSDDDNVQAEPFVFFFIGGNALTLQREGCLSPAGYGKVWPPSGPFVRVEWGALGCLCTNLQREREVPGH